MHRTPALREAHASNEPRPRGGTETILVAEDQAALREMIQELLEQQGYTVLAAADGNTALPRCTCRVT